MTWERVAGWAILAALVLWSWWQPESAELRDDRRRAAWWERKVRDRRRQ